MDSELLERLERLERQVGALEDVARFVATHLTTEPDSSGFSYPSLMVEGGTRWGLSLSGQDLEILRGAERRANGGYYFLDPAVTEATALAFTNDGLQYFESLDLGGGALAFTLAASLGADVATDANGWAVHYGLADRRVWTRRWLGVATAAAADQNVVAAASLPVDVADLGDVDIVGCHHRMSANPQRVQVAVGGGEATATLTVVAATTDGGTLASKAATIDVFVTLMER